MKTGKPTGTSDQHLGSPELSVRDGYRLWAPSYDADTAVSVLDELAVRELQPIPTAGPLLDAGCGTARRLPTRQKGVLAVGIDLVREMLLAAGRRREHDCCIAAADLRALPFPVHTFELVWCRLVLGHLPDLASAYREFFRVARARARLVVTDFHPIALAAGHTRTFRDRDAVLRAVETHPHTQGDHERAAQEAGFVLERSGEWKVGPQVRRFYEKAAALDRYEQQLGMPLLLALRFAK
jgi:malonyl-CoA O-methyltransferase